MLLRCFKLHFFVLPVLDESISEVTLSFRKQVLVQHLELLVTLFLTIIKKLDDLNDLISCVLRKVLKLKQDFVRRVIDGIAWSF